MIDTSLLIDYFRKSKKEDTLLFQHVLAGRKIFVSAITEFEILNGAKVAHRDFWEKMRGFLEVLPFDSGAARQSAEIVQEVKKIRKSIDKPDLFIAATAIENDLVFDTLNRKDFEHIKSLVMFKLI